MYMLYFISFVLDNFILFFFSFFVWVRMYEGASSAFVYRCPSGVLLRQVADQLVEVADPILVEIKVISNFVDE